MFKHRIVVFIVYFIFLFVVISCKNDKQDTFKPFINILSPTTSEVLYVYSEEEFLVELFFKDNKELSQYRALVKSDFEKDILPDLNSSLAKASSLVYVKNINDAEAKETFKVKIDENSISGNYNLMFDCVDASGNQAEPVSLNFMVKNKKDSLAPVIKIITPLENEAFSNDTSIVISILMEDTRSDFTSGFVYDLDVKVFKVSDASEEFSISQKINKKTSQSFMQTLPFISDPGEYHIKISVRDDFNNKSEITRVFRIQ